MRSTLFRPFILTVTVLAALLGPYAVATPGQATSLTQQRTALVQHLVTQANQHHLAATARLFDPAAVLAVAGHQWRGSRAVAGWWRGQFAQGLHLALASAVHLRGSKAGAVVQLSRRHGTCATGCWERASWRFSGARFSQMTLQPLSRPSPPQHGGGTIPPPPSSPPPPGVTPTIPT